MLDEAVKILSSDEPEIIIRVARYKHKVPVKLISSVISIGHGVRVYLVDGRNLVSIMKDGTSFPIRVRDKTRSNS